MARTRCRIILVEAWRTHTDFFRPPCPFRVYGYAPQINGATNDLCIYILLGALLSRLAALAWWVQSHGHSSIILKQTSLAGEQAEHKSSQILLHIIRVITNDLLNGRVTFEAAATLKEDSRQ